MAGGPVVIVVPIHTGISRQVVATDFAKLPVGELAGTDYVITVDADGVPHKVLWQAILDALPAGPGPTDPGEVFEAFVLDTGEAWVTETGEAIVL